DSLKEATGGKGKVVGLSLKDRSAILPAGRQPDACYWMDKNGRAVTSTYYRDRVHDWVKAFNESGYSKRWMKTNWTLLRPTLDYTRWSGADDVKGEGTGTKQGRTFPHPFSAEDSTYYAAVASSPMG